MGSKCSFMLTSKALQSYLLNEVNQRNLSASADIYMQEPGIHKHARKSEAIVANAREPDRRPDRR